MRLTGLPRSSFTFGVIWEQAYPYAHFSQPMRLRHYRLGLLAQFTITAMLPYLVGIVLVEPFIIFLVMLFIFPLRINAWLLWALRSKSGETWVTAHPNPGQVDGCILYLPNA